MHLHVLLCLNTHLSPLPVGHWVGALLEVQIGVGEAQINTYYLKIDVHGHEVICWEI